MSFNFAAFQTKMEQLLAVLPSLGQLVLAAETLLPTATGLTKAGLVINTVIAAEPMLAGTEQMLGTAITGVVTAYRAAGTLPATSTASTPAPVPAPPAPSTATVTPSTTK